uniref:Uncharacterized protein n=1 Tax=viral metagenome TaxID=1070528 RepID=A0A6C0F3N6_9ZZZZ
MSSSNLLDYNIFFFFILGSFSVYYFDSQENRARVHAFLKYIFQTSYNLYLSAPEEVLIIEAVDKSPQPVANVEVPYEERYIDKYNLLPLVELDKEKLASLKNCIIIEKTPLGNVIMCYDADREVFKYYTDNTIPYRMLETVGRKYVCTYQCKSIYVNMKEVLKEAEEKFVQEELLDKEKEKEQKEERLKQEKEEPEKKSVFAKFKKYNDSSNKGPSSQPSTASVSTASNRKMILKEKANHYTCEGKIFNYSIIKKVDRKEVDKKYTLTFADYKRMIQETKENMQ